MNKLQIKRLLSLIPDRQQSPNYNKLFDFEQSSNQPKIQLKTKLEMKNLPDFLTKQNINLMSFIPTRLKTQVYRKLQHSQHKISKSEDERYNTIDVSATKSRRPTEIRKISCTNSYQNQQQKSLLRKMKFSYEGRRRQNSIHKFNFESQFFIFMEVTQNLAIHKVRINKQEIITKLNNRYSNIITQKLIQFLEIPSYLEFQSWKSLVSKLFSLNQEQIIVFIFRLIHNHKHVSSTDLFQLELTIQNEAIHKDIQTILDYIQKKLNTLTIEDEELLYLRESSIFKENLTLSNLLTWTETYQIEQQKFTKQTKGMSFRKSVPLSSFISIHMLEEKQESLNHQDYVSKYPQKYQYNEPFSINFPIFRRIFLQEPNYLWKDILSFFTCQTY